MDKESLEKIFIALDVGNDGFINKDELSKLCDHFGMESLSNAELSKLYRNLDTDRDGQISKDEFFKGLFKKSTPSPTTPAELNKADKSAQRKRKVEKSENSYKNEFDRKINFTTKTANTNVTKECKQSNSLKPNTLISLANKNEENLNNKKSSDLENKQHFKSKEISKSENISKQPDNSKMSDKKIPSEISNSTLFEPKSSTKTEENQLDQANSQKKSEDIDLLHTFDDVKFRPDPVIWLNFLDETRNGEIESDVVVEFWDDLGISDGREVLKDLKLEPKGKINVEELTKKLEDQLKKDSVKNSKLHSVAVISLLHSADKLWKDNEEIVEECGRMDEEIERLKVNLKEADEVMSALEEKKDSKVFEEAIQKLESENKEIKQKLINASERYKETLECKQQYTQTDLENTDMKLNEENEIKIPKSFTSLPTKKSLHKDDYASFDFDNTDSPDEIRRKVREEMLRREKLNNEERKDLEGVMLLEVAEVEKNCESQLQKMRTQHEQKLAELKVSYARDLEDKLAEKEKEMMMDIVADKIKKKDEEGESVNELKIKQLEKELELKLNQLTGVVKDLENKNATIEKLKSELSLMEENKRERVFEEYEPKNSEDEADKSFYEEKIKNMQVDFEKKFKKLENEYEEKIKSMQNHDIDTKENKETSRAKNTDYEVEMVEMKKKYDEDAMNAANKVNELEGRLAEMKNYLNSKETTNEKLKNEIEELKNGVKKVMEKKDAEIQKLKNDLKDGKLGIEGLQEKLKQKDKDYEEAVMTLEGELQKVGDDSINRTKRKLQELDVALTEKDNEVLKLKKELRDLENSKLNNLKESKDIEDKLRRELSVVNMQHDQEIKFLKSQLKNASQEPVNESIKPFSTYKLSAENPVLYDDMLEKSQTNELQNFYESKLEEVKNTAELDKQRALKDKDDEIELIKSEHELVIGSLKRERDKMEIEKEIENKRETSNTIEDMRRKHEQKIKQITLSTNKQLNDNLKEFAEQVGELKKSFSKLEQAKESELRDSKSENEALRHEVESLKKSLQQATKIQPDSLTLDRTDVLAERDLLKDQLKQTLMQLNDVTTALTLLTNQHRADKSAWKQQASKLVDAEKLQETTNKLKAAEQNNHRLQRLLEKSQSEVAKMLIANRESFDKELRKMADEKDNNNLQMEKLRNIITDKNNIIKNFEKKQQKADILTKDLYGENARVLKYLQSVEKERNDANNRVMSLEQKIACMGELIRSLCPAAIG